MISLRSFVALAGFAFCLGVVSVPAVASADACSGGSYLFCDEFNGSSLDTTKWKKANLNIAQTHKVRPANLKLTTANDNGTTVTVIDARMFGDLHTAAPRQGGILITKKQFGGGRYEMRAKPLPGPNGCSCMWNYYDSLNETNPPPTRVYTEIDIELPGHIPALADWNQRKYTQNYNTWSHTDSDDDATYIQHTSTINPYDGKFHVFRWDWYDGKNGALKIDWYIDGVLQTSTTEHVSDHAAQLWVGSWPAPWQHMDYNFNIKHMYIDWVRISKLP